MPRLGAENRRIAVAVFGEIATVQDLAQSEEFQVQSLPGNPKSATNIARESRLPVWVFLQPNPGKHVEWDQLANGWAG